MIDPRVIPPNSPPTALRFVIENQGIVAGVLLDIIVLPLRQNILSFNFAAGSSINVPAQSQTIVAASINTCPVPCSWELGIVFRFKSFEGNVERGAAFLIARKMLIKVGDPLDISLLQPSAPYRKVPAAHRRVVFDRSQAVPGEPLPRSSSADMWVVPLDFYNIPLPLKTTVIEGPGAVELHMSDSTNLPSKLQNLLWLEEIQMEVDICQFDLIKTRMERAGRYLALKVPGLAERRPSVLYGDKVYVSTHTDESEAGAPNKKKWQGIVHAVRDLEVLLAFNGEFQATYVAAPYPVDVRFSFGRLPIRRMHQAAAGCGNIPNVILPSIEHVPIETFPRANLKFFDPNLNDEQKDAVIHIISNQHGRAPFLIHGPPGTGKTVTLVESIKQVLDEKGRGAQARILACAPSNSAADLIAMRLLPYRFGNKKTELLRLNAYTRETPDDDPLAEVIHRNASTGRFDVPKMEALKRFRVIVSTCVNAGTLIGVGLPRGHFTHIFIDEAGQATEPEVLVPLSGFAIEQTRVVLAGDHKQLGPIVRSPHALKYGLDKSLLERLFTLPLYQASATATALYQSNVTVRLLKNYRSHPAILDLPSRLFYDGALQPFASRPVVDQLCRWEFLPNQDQFPLLFKHVDGKDERESTSPSWFNIAEAQTVLAYIQNMIRARNIRVSASDIGVIAPYRRQVQKLRTLFSAKGLDGIKVGSVEEFQGQERLVIIVSTVRSDKSFLSFDSKHALGFLQNPKRFNVAVTRAKALLVVVGSANVLCEDEQWRAFIEYCHQHRAYDGPPLPSIDDSALNGPGAALDRVLDRLQEEPVVEDDSEEAEGVQHREVEWPEGR